ncbi:hypothetical protein HPB47_008241, partial [Ixodes persulcatus]
NEGFLDVSIKVDVTFGPRESSLRVTTDAAYRQRLGGRMILRRQRAKYGSPGTLRMSPDFSLSLSLSLGGPRMDGR